jgi:integrase
MATQKRSRFGSVRRLPSGRYQARFTIPGSEKMVTAPTTFTTKGDAYTWLDTQRADIERGVWRPGPQSLTFGEYAERWHAERDLRPRTAAHYRRTIDRFLLPAFGDVQLAAITPEMVRSWFARLETGPVYRQHAYALLRTITRTAAEDGFISASPCIIKGAGRMERSKDITLPSLDELGVIVDNTPEQYRLMVLLAAWGGFRFGELAELRRKDVDMRKGVIHVRRAVSWVNGEPIVGPPKSRAGIRDVHIPPHLLPAVKEHLKDHAALELLFPSSTGRQLRSQEWWEIWQIARDAARRQDLHFHHLRHLGAVLAAQSGATIKELMARLGHSTPDMAIHYQHVAADRDAVIAKRLSELAERG